MSGESGILIPPAGALRPRRSSFRREDHDAPPSAILEAVEAAGHIAEALARRDRELHFSTGFGGRSVVELRRLDGTFIRRLTALEAVDVMAGLADVE
jgi:hypothetical protein